MRAFIVWIEGDMDGAHEVVLATSMTEAKRRSELRWQGTARKHLRAKRYPRFDGYPRVSDRDLLHNGWLLTCGECDREFDLDTIAALGGDPDLIDSALCPYCNPEDYGLAGDAWRKGRKCATCRHYSREDEYCWRSGSGVMVPCHPGFDEDDPHMIKPLDCWEPAGGEQ